MDVSELLSLLGRPRAEPFAVDWSAVEAWLDTPLPTAYKQIGSSYGPWFIGEWIWVEVPCGDQQSDLGYTRWLPETTRHTRIRAREHHADLPLLHPAPEGLLAWGKTRKTDVLFWDTTASAGPDAWQVVVFTSGVGPLDDPWSYTGLTTVDFLGAVVTEGVQITQHRRLGPLPRVARRTEFRVDAPEWTPPAPTAPDPEELAARQRALTEGTGLSALQALVPPPRSPRLGPGRWDALFDTLATPLPDEYVELMTTYGAGAWGGYLRFPSPLDPGPDGLAALVRSATDAYRGLRGKFAEHFPLAVWPEPGGLLPFANSVDGDCLGWLTNGSPEEWSLVIWPRDGEQRPPLATGLVDTLLTYMRGHPVPGLATLDPDDDPLDFATFTSWESEENAANGFFNLLSRAVTTPHSLPSWLHLPKPWKRERVTRRPGGRGVS